ncbi:hypothetical protein [Lapidilactobacillus bayanensis]|uniref:hypothetical protein n=1 Tax=Lapidilactobacillus bayanensis TaxID=2485998 RepID=UPI000F78F3A4|nr:hypothetical protein [Lapidilactobacillus bayanensis]
MPIKYIVSLVLIIIGIIQIYLTAGSSRRIVKQGSASTSPFSLMSLGSSFIIGILIVAAGISAAFVNF